MDPIQFLSCANGRPWIFWADRERREIVAGIGAAWTTDNPSSVPEGVRVYGGVRFDQGQDSADPEWEAFGKAWFCLPEHELRIGETGAQLVSRSDATFGDPSWEAGKLQVSGGTSSPDFSHWSESIEQILELCAAGEREKLVLARSYTLTLDASVHPLDILSRLHQSDGSCYDFAFSPNGQDIFFGSSPERLFAYRHGTVYTEAVAGTRPAGDEEGRALLASDKDRREHEIVIDSICTVLGPLTESISVQRPTRLLQRRHWQHLWTPIRAKTLTTTGPMELLSALHPTPAVGGEPRQGAEEAIRALEGFDRGWYAGAVGWVEHDAAEFSVGIRSGLLTADALRFYAGAGIVAGSTAQSEWDETETKLQGMYALCKQ